MPHVKRAFCYAVVLSLLNFANSARAQSVRDISPHNYQLSLVGLRPIEATARQEQGHIAVVVSHPVVIRHFQSAPRQINQLRRQFAGGCGCGI